MLLPCQAWGSGSAGVLEGDCKAQFHFKSFGIKTLGGSWWELCRSLKGMNSAMCPECQQRDQKQRQKLSRKTRSCKEASDSSLVTLSVFHVVRRHR
ncbi:hypothetical protein AV530_000634 [Patagioenas fasciata monilis]|uniref:Uncharacterized protein n=1 Tax=Patagioenas fasciata monilis TaxID=372326 RepID=A0A1V4IFX2_PATFA|nr:hypothetical protein AV530_000634 [Patagioenas fasciata monilis]